MIIIILIAVLILASAAVIRCLYKSNRTLRFLLEHTEAINDRMINISEELGDFSDINVLYDQLLKETMDLIDGAESGSILVYNKDTGFMDYKACFGFNIDSLKNVHLKKEELFLYESTKLMAADITVNPLQYDRTRLEKENFDDLLHTNALDIKSSLSAPLYINSEFYGIINVDNKTRIDSFDKKAIKLITYISKELEIAIKNVNLMNELIDALKTDKLTNIFNRRYFEETMESLVGKKSEIDVSYALVMIDIDDFKYINDNYGHKCGDEVLIYFADKLTKIIRNGDMAVRYAGDEFILFLNNANEEIAKLVVGRINQMLKDEPYRKISITISAGICTFDSTASLDSIMTSADNDMYKNKKEKKYGTL
jgi:diguanylate cyclase (GGDEF)-like protein